jgi:hypothetical protein
MSSPSLFLISFLCGETSGKSRLFSHHTVLPEVVRSNVALKKAAFSHITLSLLKWYAVMLPCKRPTFLTSHCPSWWYAVMLPWKKADFSHITVSLLTVRSNVALKKADFSHITLSLLMVGSNVALKSAKFSHNSIAFLHT